MRSRASVVSVTGRSYLRKNNQGGIPEEKSLLRLPCSSCFSITYFDSAYPYLVSQVKNHAPRNPTITPSNGENMANQNGIASRKGRESRLRICGGCACDRGMNCMRDFSISNYCVRRYLSRKELDSGHRKFPLLQCR